MSSINNNIAVGNRQQKENEMNKIIVTITAISLSACISIPSKEIINTEEAQKEYVSCLYKKAHQLDDGKSDALTIAKSVKSTCKYYEMRYAESDWPNTSQYQKTILREKILSQTDIPLTTVLEARKDNK